MARPAARSRARGSTPAASCVHAAESDSQLGHAAPWHTAARQRAAALLAGVSLLASAPVSPFPATADAAGRSTIQFQQTVNARRLLREALPIDLSKSPLAEAEDLLESIADTLPRSAGAPAARCRSGQRGARPRGALRGRDARRQASASQRRRQL